ncbi:MAG: hypothetical protein ACXWPS_09425, partial [Ktedonobacteraceae bacterium]
MAVAIENIEEQPIQQKRAAQVNRARGERVHTAKLRERDVRAIRLLYANHILNSMRLAENYNVHPSTIGDVVNLNSWKHVTDGLNGGR